jgi:hypothetical protein
VREPALLPAKKSKIVSPVPAFATIPLLKPFLEHWRISCWPAVAAAGSVIVGVLVQSTKYRTEAPEGAWPVGRGAVLEAPTVKALVEVPVGHAGPATVDAAPVGPDVPVAPVGPVSQ